MRIKRLVVLFSFALTFATSVFVMMPHSASASYAYLCGGFSRLNRAGCVGYFRGINYYSTYGIQGQNIIDCTKAPSVCTGGEAVNNAIPAGVTDAASFIAWVKGYLGSGTSYNYNKAGAAFIVDAMLGRWGTDYGSTAAGVAYAQAHIDDWAARVSYYDAAGRVTWNTPTTLPSGTINSLHACWPSISNCTVGNISSYDSQDFAFFRNPDAEWSHIITFHNPDGSVFEIRRECGNLLGQLAPLVLPDFNLTPSVSASVNGGPATAAEVGDTIKFNYVVNNSGSMSSENTGCSTYANTFSGYYTAPGSPSPGGPGGPNPGCPRNFGPGSTTVASETIVAATGNQTICRSLFVNPATYNGGQRGAETCVIVANKPYMKVYGGDVSVGDGLSTAPNTCTNNNNGGVAMWNKRVGGGYAGAGTQYATYALSVIEDFATAQGNAGGAPIPTGLSFANTSTNTANGNYGGTFGSVSCIPDYYSTKPGTTNPIPANVSSMTTNAYAGIGTVTLAGGTVNPNNKIQVFVNGNLYITSDISYTPNWNFNNTPMFEVVVKGNIYISSNVHRLDGTYVAQSSGVAGTGTVYTCATGATPINITGGAFYNTCNSQLVVNGSFTANSIEFLRTYGSLQQSASGTSETVANTHAGEVFNYSPAAWMIQPNTGPQQNNYDAITSLPPIL